jgi:hypothetical protein
MHTSIVVRFIRIFGVAARAHHDSARIAVIGVGDSPFNLGRSHPMSTQSPQPPYGQPPYGQPTQSINPYTPPAPGYAQPPYGYTQVNVVPALMQPATKASGLAVASLVLGIISLVFFWLIFPIVCALLAIIFGHVAISAINRSSGWLTGKGMAIAGLVMGYIHIGFWILWVIVLANA